MATLDVIHSPAVPLATGKGPLNAGHVLDALHERATKLSALLAVTYGDTEDTFSQWSHEWRDSYMWACADMAREIRDLLNAHSDLLHSKTPK